MPTTIRIYGLIVACLILMSCEEEITLDLNEVPPQLVIEGFITDQPGPYTVRLTKTANFYDTNSFPPQSGAVITISDDMGQEEVLVETDSGIYETKEMMGVRGRSYTLKVDFEGKTHTASAQIPLKQIPLDSIGIKFEEETIFFDEGYFATAYFLDPAGIEDYYRLNFFVNGEPYVWFADDDDQDNIEDDNFWLWSDKYSDGNLQDYEFPQRLDLSDTVSIELHHLDKSTYEYYRTLIDAQETGGLAPSNPISNFGKEVLGYFGAFSVTSNQTIVE